MEKKVKFGITAGNIVCIILGAIGCIYLAVGISLLLSYGDEEAFGAGLTFALFGSLLLLSIGIVLLIEWRRRTFIRQLVENQRYIWCTIESVELNRNIRINGRHPYYAVVRYRDHTGTIHNFRSRNLMKLPDFSLVGKQVQVYVDESNYRRYYVDLDRILYEYHQH
jgi:hypothetical protein